LVRAGEGCLTGLTVGVHGGGDHAEKRARAQAKLRGKGGLVFFLAVFFLAVDGRQRRTYCLARTILSWWRRGRPSFLSTIPHEVA
jgi:hypothetical protein